PNCVLSAAMFGIGNSVMVPPGVTRATCDSPGTCPTSVNQTLPSDPGVITIGRLTAVGVANSVTVPLGAMRPTWLGDPNPLVNHRFPSGPSAIVLNERLAPVGNSVIAPEGVMRPIWLP